MSTRKVIGFTGSRAGMTGEQEAAVKVLLKAYRDTGVEWFMHGDCVGADALAHRFAIALGYQTIGAPCDLAQYRAHCECTEVQPVSRPLTRNRRIVKAAWRVIACPNTMNYQTRSGTWWTVKESRTTKTPLLLVLPTGKVRAECLSYWE
jgi:hypothetical protein